MIEKSTSTLKTIRKNKGALIIKCSLFFLHEKCKSQRINVINNLSDRLVNSVPIIIDIMVGHISP